MQAIHQPIPTQVQAEQNSAQSPNPNRGRKPNFRAMLRNKEMQAALGSGLLMLVAWGTSPYFNAISIMLYIVSYAIGGWTKAKEGVETLVRTETWM